MKCSGLLTNLNIGGYINLYKVLLKTIILICIFSFPLFSQDLIIENGETMIYKIQNKDGSTYTSKTTYFVSELNNETIYSYRNQDDLEIWDVTTDINAFPKEINFATRGNQIKLVFNDTGEVKMSGVWNGEIVEQTGQFDKNITLENAMVVRTLDLDSRKRYVFDLLQTDKFPELKSFKMYFKVIGDESVAVNAGTFDCKKVLFTIKGLGRLFYKAEYYISNDKHRYIVKIENMPMNCDTELEQIYYKALNE